MVLGISGNSGARQPGLITQTWGPRGGAGLEPPAQQ